MKYAIFWWSSATMRAGTKPKLDHICVLARGNPQRLSVLDLSS
jgi:hypothetical protein